MVVIPLRSTLHYFFVDIYGRRVVRVCQRFEVKLKTALNLIIDVWLERSLERNLISTFAQAQIFVYIGSGSQFNAQLFAGGEMISLLQG